MGAMTRCLTCKKEVVMRNGYEHVDGSPPCIVDDLFLMQRVVVDGAVCDFCMATPAPWTLLTETIGIGMLFGSDDPEEEPRSVTHVESPEWACCGDCKRLIEKDRWDALSEKSLRRHERQEGPLDPELRDTLRGALRELHAKVREEWIGSIVRSADEVQENP